MLDDSIDEIFDFLKWQDSNLPEEGYTYTIREDDGGDYVCVGAFDGEDQWMTYNMPVDEVPRCQRDDIQRLLAEERLRGGEYG